MSDNAKLDALLDMVPLYVNGTLGAEEKRAFETALENTPELREELERETALQKRFVQEMDSALGDSTAGSKPQSLFGSPASSQADTGSGGFASALSFLNPANWNPAVTFALAAAAVSQTAIIGSQAATISDLEDENYQLASGKGECESDPAIIVELAGDAQWGAVTALLDAQQLSISGTGSFGVLQLSHDNENADTAQIIDTLSGSPLIASAERAN